MAAPPSDPGDDSRRCQHVGVPELLSDPGARFHDLGPDHFDRHRGTGARKRNVGMRLGMLDVVRTEDEHILVGRLGPDILGPDSDPAAVALRLATAGRGRLPRRCWTRPSSADWARSGRRRQRSAEAPRLGSPPIRSATRRGAARDTGDDTARGGGAAPGAVAGLRRLRPGRAALPPMWHPDPNGPRGRCAEGSRDLLVPYVPARSHRRVANPMRSLSPRASIAGRPRSSPCWIGGQTWNRLPASPPSPHPKPSCSLRPGCAANVSCAAGTSARPTPGRAHTEEGGQSGTGMRSRSRYAASSNCPGSVSAIQRINALMNSSGCSKCG